MKITIWGAIARRNLLTATLAVAVLGSAGAVQAGSLHITGGTVDDWTTEAGQSIPTGVNGFVAGTLFADSADTYSFTYGGGGRVAGDTGHGDSSFSDEFWVGTSEAAAAAAGHVFCTRPGDAACGGAATAVGAHFTIFLNVGAIPFGFTFGPSSSVLLNGQSNSAVGAYMVQVGAGATAFAGPGTLAYLGLADQAYPGDADFQDLVVQASGVPEPASLVLMGVGLISTGIYRRRR